MGGVPCQTSSSPLTARSSISLYLRGALSEFRPPEAKANPVGSKGSGTRLTLSSPLPSRRPPPPSVPRRFPLAPASQYRSAEAAQPPSPSLSSPLLASPPGLPSGSPAQPDGKRDDTLPTGCATQHNVTSSRVARVALFVAVRSDTP